MFALIEVVTQLGGQRTALDTRSRNHVTSPPNTPAERRGPGEKAGGETSGGATADEEGGEGRIPRAVGVSDALRTSCSQCDRSGRGRFLGHARTPARTLSFPVDGAACRRNKNAAARAGNSFEPHGAMPCRPRSPSFPFFFSLFRTVYVFFFVVLSLKAR